MPVPTATPEQIFDAVFPGRRLPDTDAVGPVEVFLTFARRTARVIDPNISVFLVSGDSVNAFCFSESGRDFIGLHFGLAVVVLDTFQRMLALPDLFPKIGNAAGETRSPIIEQPPRSLFDIVSRPHEQVFTEASPTRLKSTPIHLPSTTASRL
jgi:hypothetical protein